MQCITLFICCNTLPLTFICCNTIMSTYPLAAIPLILRHCNLLWRLFYFFITHTTSSGGHPTCICIFSSYTSSGGYSTSIVDIATSIGGHCTSTSSLQPPLALLLLLHHLCNLLWRFYYTSPARGQVQIPLLFVQPRWSAFPCIIRCDNVNVFARDLFS